MIRKRTKSRELALQFLYQYDLRGNEILDSIDDFLKESAKEPEIKDYCIKLIEGTIKNRKTIDEKISKQARNWSIYRMPVIDRNVLRLAIFEMEQNEVPMPVIINEAIELGKKFSTEQSGSFINGLLDKIFSSIKKT